MATTCGGESSKFLSSEAGWTTEGEIEGMIKLPCSSRTCGAIAQLGERIVRNDEVVGSIPTSSTKLWSMIFFRFNRVALSLYSS